jgi:hypothetical protein
MATLSLKKPKFIGDTPLENIQQKFVVMRQSRRHKAFRFGAVHDTFEQAEKEAKRLAKNDQGQRFLVLQVQGFAEWEACNG